MNKTEIKVFLASSSELELERVHIGDFFNDINSILMDTNIRIRLLKWEVFDPSFKGERKQTEYDHQVKKSDIFIALFRTLKGKYTIEEINVAKIAHKEIQKPKELYCFIQDWLEERKFSIEELKNELGEYFNIVNIKNINDLKYKIIKILTPFLNENNIPIIETENFIKINSINILKK